MPLQSRRLRREFLNDIDRQDKVGSLTYVDDRTLTRDCVAGQLIAWLPEFSVSAVANHSEIGELPSDARARSILYNTHSLRIEDVEYLRNLPAMQRAEPELRVAVLSDLESRENIIAALRHGVSGYLLTSLSLKIASEVIRLVHAGGTFVPSSAVLDAEKPAFSEGNSVSLAPKLHGFTPRQVEVLSRLREGKQNKAIAFELNMAESTVKVHLHHIMQKLQATNRMQVILRTRQLFEERDMHCADAGTVSAVWPMDLAPRAGEARF
jgi:DNA-binding NarL/FixJ family response regulator